MMFADVPDLAIDEDLQWIWRAYHRLSASRTWLGGGMGAAIPAPIAFEAVLQWGEYHDYTSAMIDLLDACTVAMDVEYCKYMQEQARKN